MEKSSNGKKNQISNMKNWHKLCSIWSYLRTMSNFLFFLLFYFLFSFFFLLLLFFSSFFLPFSFFFSSLFFSFSFYFEIRRKNDWLKMKGNKNDKGLNDTTLMSKESKTQNWWWFFLFFISIRRWKGNKIDKGH